MPLVGDKIAQLRWPDSRVGAVDSASGWLDACGANPATAAIGVPARRRAGREPGRTAALPGTQPVSLTATRPGGSYCACRAVSGLTSAWVGRFGGRPSRRGWFQRRRPYSRGRGPRRGPRRHRRGRCRIARMPDKAVVRRSCRLGSRSDRRLLRGSLRRRRAGAGTPPCRSRHSVRSVDFVRDGRDGVSSWSWYPICYCARGYREATAFRVPDHCEVMAMELGGPPDHPRRSWEPPPPAEGPTPHAETSNSGVPEVDFGFPSRGLAGNGRPRN